MSQQSRPRMLTGDRPTGPLHLGHLVGSLNNRVALQETHDAYFIIADLHMLTTRNSPEDIAQIDQRARGLVLDALSAGIDPARATFYLQSADILSVRAQAVPVGKDNYGFVEVTRELARRFNRTYSDVFPVPEIIKSNTPTLIGTDGQAKMSKSLGNSIALADDPATVRRTVMRMYTDPARTSADVPGTVEGNPVFAWLDVFGTDRARIDDFTTRYRAGTVGDVEVAVLEPMRERREQYSGPGYVESLIVSGTARVRAETQETIRDMRKAMGFTGAWNRLRRRAERLDQKAGARPETAPILINS